MLYRSPPMLDEASIRLIKLFMTICLGIFSVLFLYVLYNLVSGIAGSLVALLFFITVAFFIVLLKVFKMFHQFANFNNANNELKQNHEADNFSLPPSYEEAVKNQPIATVSANVPYQPPTTVQHTVSFDKQSNIATVTVESETTPSHH